VSLICAACWRSSLLAPTRCVRPPWTFLSLMAHRWLAGAVCGQDKRDYYNDSSPVALLVWHLVAHPSFSVESLELLLDHGCHTNGQGLLHTVMYKADSENAEAVAKLLIPHVSVTEKAAACLPLSRTRIVSRLPLPTSFNR
jgi:hypothetical protein